MTVMVKRMASFVVVALLVATAASARERKDLEVFRGAADAVNRYTLLTVFDSISASVDDGQVVLTGWVTMPYKRDDLARRVLTWHISDLKRSRLWQI